MRIAAHNLTKVYRGNIHALRSLDLTIPTGLFGLLGPNGAGKTTLMRILAGVLRPTGGTLSIGDYDGTTEQGRASVKRVLGYLPQDLGMYPDLSAYEFLDYVGILKGLDERKTRRQRVEQLIELVALSNVAKRKLKTFSGGMKRRVGIAQALLNEPQLLIVDEPTAGLDPEERIRFRNLLADLGADGNRTVLLSTHIVEDVAQTCNNLAVMRQGQIVFQGTIAEMLGKARSKVWSITTNDAKPEGDITIVSAVRTGAGMQYRIVGDVLIAGAQPTEPTLEDAYVWLMRPHAATTPTTANA